MKACIIMHNMIIEDEGAMNLGFGQFLYISVT